VVGTTSFEKLRGSEQTAWVRDRAIEAVLCCDQYRVLSNMSERDSDAICNPPDSVTLSVSLLNATVSLLLMFLVSHDSQRLVDLAARIIILVHSLVPTSREKKKEPKIYKENLAA
jgi:hypothetical protein